MKEQSHKDEMSAAIRGDFRRLRERGVTATLAPRDEAPESGPVETLPEPPPAPLEQEVPSGPPVDAAAARPGFMARLLGR